MSAIRRLWNRFRHRVRFGLRDLYRSPTSTLATIVCGSITVAVALVMGHIGISLYQDQARTTDPTMFRRIELLSRNPDDPACRFTPTTLQELVELPGVLHAFPRLDVDVELSNEAGDVVSVVLEGSPPGDRALAAERLTDSQERPLQLGERELILSHSAASKLGISSGQSRMPASVTLTVRRVTGGVTQTVRIAFEVLTVLKNFCKEEGHLSLDTAWAIDLWLRHKIDTIPISVEPLDVARSHGEAKGRESGTIRCTIDAESVGMADQLLSRLSSDRWEVVDRTGERKALIALAVRLLMGLGTIFTTFYLLAAVSVGTLGWLRADSKREEASFLRSFGLSKVDIVGLRLLQGGWLSLASATVGLSLALIAMGLLRKYVTMEQGSPPPRAILGWTDDGYGLLILGMSFSAVFLLMSVSSILPLLWIKCRK